MFLIIFLLLFKSNKINSWQNQIEISGGRDIRTPTSRHEKNRITILTKLKKRNDAILTKHRTFDSGDEVPVLCSFICKFKFYLSISRSVINVEQKGWEWHVRVNVG